MNNIKFKLEIDTFNPVPCTVTKYFKSLKILRQWQKRNNLENQFFVLGYREYVLNKESKWERFVIFGTNLVLISELIDNVDLIIKSEEERRKIFEGYKVSEHEE